MTILPSSRIRTKLKKTFQRLSPNASVYLTSAIQTIVQKILDKCKPKGKRQRIRSEEIKKVIKSDFRPVYKHVKNSDFFIVDSKTVRKKKEKVEKPAKKKVEKPAKKKKVEKPTKKKISEKKK